MSITLAVKNQVVAAAILISLTPTFNGFTGKGHVIPREFANMADWETDDNPEQWRGYWLSLQGQIDGSESVFTGQSVAAGAAAPAPSAFDDD